MIVRSAAVRVPVSFDGEEHRMPDNPGLKIYRVDLLDKSYKSYRVLNGGDAAQFWVRVWFSRPVDGYERVELARHGFTVVEDDPLQAVVTTTPDQFESTFDQANRVLAAAEENARKAKAAAEEEDEHMRALVQKINLRLRPEQLG
jgi:hypothetical protein